VSSGRAPVVGNCGGSRRNSRQTRPGDPDSRWLVPRRLEAASTPASAAFSGPRRAGSPGTRSVGWPPRRWPSGSRRHPARASDASGLGAASWFDSCESTIKSTRVDFGGQGAYPVSQQSLTSAGPRNEGPGMEDRAAGSRPPSGGWIPVPVSSTPPIPIARGRHIRGRNSEPTASRDRPRPGRCAPMRPNDRPPVQPTTHPAVPGRMNRILPPLSSGPPVRRHSGRSKARPTSGDCYRWTYNRWGSDTGSLRSSP
jgi:hypothetical protein